MSRPKKSDHWLIQVECSPTAIDKVFKILKYLRHIGQAGGTDTISAQYGDMQVHFDGDGLDKIGHMDVVGPAITNDILDKTNQTQ